MTVADEALGNINQMLKGLEHERATLLEAREQLEAQIIELEEKRDEYDEAIKKVDGVLGPLKQSPQPRARGVKQLAETVLRDLSTQKEWLSQSEVVDAVVARDDAMKPHSVVSSLGRLVEEGVIIRRGKRGSHEYALAKGQSTASGAEPADNVDPESPEEPFDIVLGKLKDAGDQGCTRKDLGWAVGDAVNLDGILDKLIQDGDVKSAPSGNEIRYVLLPRVQQQKPLFAGADAPDQPTT